MTPGVPFRGPRLAPRRFRPGPSSVPVFGPLPVRWLAGPSALTVANPKPGNYMASFAQTPSGALTGIGTATNRANPIVIPVTATAFGTYGQLSLTAPDGKPNARNPTALKTPLSSSDSRRLRASFRYASPTTLRRARSMTSWQP